MTITAISMTTGIAISRMVVIGIPEDFTDDGCTLTGVTFA